MRAKLFRDRSNDFSLSCMLLVALAGNCIQSFYLARYHAIAESGASVSGALRLEDLRLVQPDGTPLRELERSKPSIIYILSPTCGWCRLNSANIQAIALQTSGRYNLYGGVPEAKLGEKQIQDLHVGFPVYPLLVTSGDVDALTSTPQTLVFVEGKLVRRWAGFYTGATRRAVEEFFDVQLPPEAHATNPHP